MIDLRGTWRLADLGGLAPATAGGGPVVLTFDGDGQVYGMAGVNRVRGTFEVDEDGTLRLGPMASTMMAGPDDAMATERAVLELLAEPLRIASDGGALVLTALDGVVARLVRYTEPPMA